jgi:hypothetical protein
MSWHQSLGYGKERQQDDYYATPSIATTELLRVEVFGSPIWEPASGNGAISKVLEAAGLTVISSDLRTDGVYGEGGIDFLATKKEGIKSIITNPPFKLSREFILHSLKQADKVAIFGRIQMLEGARRHSEIYSLFPPTRIWVFSKRVSTQKDGIGKANGTVCFAWFVWEKGVVSPPQIGWVNIKK